jgi:large subunit ribosomal protein L40e
MEVVQNTFNDIITINTLNSKKIHIKYNPHIQTIKTIYDWFFNEFKYKLINFEHYKYNFLDEKNNVIPITDSVEDTINITKNIKKFYLSIQDMNSQKKVYRPELFEETYNSFHMYVKTLTGKSFPVSLNQLNETTIYDLKLHIQEKDSIPVDQIRLIFAGRELDDKKFLSDYNLIRNGNIHMVLRLCGGMFNEVSGRNGAYEPLTENFFDISDF